MNKNVPTIALVLAFKGEVKTYYKVRNSYFSINVPNNKKYEHDITDDLSLKEIVRLMVNYVVSEEDEDDFDKSYPYEIEFIDHDFLQDLTRELTHPSMFSNIEGYEYAMSKVEEYRERRI